MGQVPAFRIDLNSIEGDGEFPCPSCGAPISPDDESEATYEITDIKTKEDGSLETLSVLCKQCGSTINLEGFKALNGLDDSY
jgi:hypothetical protein